MNKPLHLHQDASTQTAIEKRINRNLSPSLARIQALAAKVSPPNSQAATGESVHKAAPDKTDQARPSPGGAQHLATEQTGNSRKILQPPPPIAKQPSSVPASTGITPWLIASITLTLALFSGNYAWHTQQQVEALNLRLDQLEAQTATLPALGLQESNDSFAKTEQQLFTLKETQGQLNTTISTLQSELAADAEQTGSRLETLETNLEELISQAHKAAIKKSGNKPPEAQSINNESRTAATVATTNNETSNSSKGIESTEGPATGSWLINIASFSDPRAANGSYEKVLKIVDKASVKPMTINGKTVYRVRAESYRSLAQAEREALALQTQLGLSGLWVSRD